MVLHLGPDCTQSVHRSYCPPLTSGMDGNIVKESKRWSLSTSNLDELFRFSLDSANFPSEYERMRIRGTNAGIVPRRFHVTRCHDPEISSMYITFVLECRRRFLNNQAWKRVPSIYHAPSLSCDAIHASPSSSSSSTCRTRSQKSDNFLSARISCRRSLCTFHQWPFAWDCVPANRHHSARICPLEP